MKRRIKRAVGTIIVVLLIAIGVCKLGYLVRPVKSDSSLKAIDTFHDIPENSIEVIGYGSSHMWRGMNPIQMYNKYGIGAYNYGCNWQHLNTTLLFLKDSLRTQSPKVVLIETYLVHEIKENINVDGEIYYTTRINDFEGKRQYLHQCFGEDKERYLSYYMPLCAFHDNWIDLKEASFKKGYSSKNDYYKTMGFVESNDVTEIKIPDFSEFEQKKLDKKSIDILDEMVSICRERDIDIIFYTAPYQGKYSYAKAMKKYAEENECVYFDLFEYVDEIGFDGKKDFSDKGHLNTSGSNKVADFLGKYIVENYDVTDFRDIEGNMWELNQLR